MIPRSLPFGTEEILVANKTGWDEEKNPDAKGFKGDVRNDAAYVKTPKMRYVIAICARRIQDKSSGVDNETLRPRRGALADGLRRLRRCRTRRRADYFFSASAVQFRSRFSGGEPAPSCTVLIRNRWPSLDASNRDAARLQREQGGGRPRLEGRRERDRQRP